MNIKSGLPSIAATVLLVGLSGCGSSSNTPAANSSTAGAASPTATATGASPSAGNVLVTIKDFSFTIPASVSPGTTVTVKNEDNQNHTFSSSPAGSFDVTVNAGSSATFTTPTKAGSYKVICHFHANMKGNLVVK